MELLEKEASDREKLQRDHPNDLDNPPCFTISYESLKSDMIAIQLEQNLRLSETTLEGKKFWFDALRHHLTTKALRSRRSAAEKRAIAKVLGGLVLGIKPRSVTDISLGKGADQDNINSISVSKINRHLVVGDVSCADDISRGDLEGYWTGDSCDSLRRIYPWKDLNPHLISKLEGFWGSMTRRIAVDAGTTMDEFCRVVLAGAKFLRSPDLLTSLEVCVNSREGFNILGEPAVDAKTMCLGGFQEQNAEALCGPYTEKFLECLDLRFGITFVGATCVDFQTGQFGSDHERDARIKRKLLERGNLRVVVADSSKFSRIGMQSYHPFCPITSECVDLVVTDSFSGVLKSLGEKVGRNRQENQVKILDIFKLKTPIIEAGDAMVFSSRSEVEKEQKLGGQISNLVE